MLYILSCGHDYLVHAASSSLLQGWPALLSSHISRSRLTIPIREAHPICSFLCCETGVSVYQLSNAPIYHVHFHSHLPLVHHLTTSHPRACYFKHSVTINIDILKRYTCPAFIAYLSFFASSPNSSSNNRTLHRHDAFVPTHYSTSTPLIEEVCLEQHMF
jgi:hypothetical protein